MADHSPHRIGEPVIYRDIHFSGFAVDVPPLWLEIDPSLTDLQDRFCEAIANHAGPYLTGSQVSGLVVSGHPDRAYGIIHAPNHGNRRGAYLGGFTVQEGRPPLTRALKPRLGPPVVLAGLVALLFISALFFDDFDVTFNLAYVGRMIKFMAIAAGIAVVATVAIQVQEWRNWEESPPG